MIRITMEGPKDIPKLSGLSEEMKNKLFEALLQARELIVATSRSEYLSGPYPDKLGPDTGDLRDRGPYVVAGISGEPGELGRITVGPPGVWYGKVHEQKGIPGDQFVIQARTPRGMSFFWKRRNKWVRGAQRVTIPARPFLLPALIDNLEKIKNLIHSSLSSAYRASISK